MDQALPNQFPDLGTLFTYMPAIAAAQSGTQQRIAEQNNQSLQNAFGNEQNYLVNEKRPADLAQTLAQTEYMKQHGNLAGAQAEGLGLANQFTKATQPGKIEVTKAENQNKLTESELKGLEDFGSLVKQASAQSAVAIGPGAKAAVVKKVLGNHLQDHPELDNLLSSAGDALPQVLSDLSDNIFKGTSAYRLEQQKTEAHQKAVETAAEATKSAAGIAANSREQVAATQAGAKIQAVHDKAEMDLKNRGAALAAQAAQEADPAKKAELLRQANQANAFAAYMAKINAQARNEVGIAASNLIPGTKPPEDVQPALTAPNEAPPQVSPPSAPKGKVPDVPTAAITYLMSHPETAAQFDAKYGAGASKAILQGK